MKMLGVSDDNIWVSKDGDFFPDLYNILVFKISQTICRINSTDTILKTVQSSNWFSGLFMSDIMITGNSGIFNIIYTKY